MAKYKYNDIFDRWLKDDKWQAVKPFMIGNFLCYSTSYVEGKKTKYIKHTYDMTDKSRLQMLADGVPLEVVRFLDDFYN